LFDVQISVAPPDAEHDSSVRVARQRSLDRAAGSVSTPAGGQLQYGQFALLPHDAIAIRAASARCFVTAAIRMFSPPTVPEANCRGKDNEWQVSSRRLPRCCSPPRSNLRRRPRQGWAHIQIRLLVQMQGRISSVVPQPVRSPTIGHGWPPIDAHGVPTSGDAAEAGWVPVATLAIANMMSRDSDANIFFMVRASHDHHESVVI
jgi:hypothetical protein